MEIRGKVIKLLDEINGESGRGTWRKQGVIIEIPGNFPKNICVDVWGDNIDAFQLKPDEEVLVQIDVESREYNGKWFTNVKAWKVERPNAESNPDRTSEVSTEDPYSQMPEGEEDDLPF